MATTQERTAPATVGWSHASRLPTAGPGLVARARGEPLLMLFVVGALIARIVFWATTNRMFEDGLTTITFARNVPLGLGLVHHTGEGPIHGFTSALGVLIPLAGELLHEDAGMTAMRIASLAGVTVALVYVRFLCRDLGVGAFPTAFVLAYLAFDQNMIFYGMAGMETEVAVAIILAGVYHVHRHEFVAAGICLGLAPLARPEFVLWVVPALIYLAAVDRRRALVSSGIAAAIVAPWVVFTTLYYGSPIPNTIVAKNNIYPIPSFLTDGSIAPWLSWLGSQVSGHAFILLYKLEPFREVWSTASTPLPDPVLAVVAIAVVYFFVLGVLGLRARRGMWPALAFLGLFLAYRVYFIPALNYYDWYLPPFLGLVMVVAASGMQRMSTSITIAPRTVAVALSVAFAIHMPFSFPVEGKVQTVENTVRTNVGLYLRANVQPGQSVLSESAGYIGFYGRQKLYDYPGLTSKVSVRALQALPPGRRGIADLIAAVQPDWLVLRPWELDSLHAEYPDLAATYQVAKVFEMPGIPESRLNTHGAAGVEFAGYAQVDIDMKFTVLRRIQT